MATIPLLPVTGCAGSRAFRRPVDPCYIERETHRRVSIFSRIYGGTARKHEEEVARKAAGRCTRFRSPILPLLEEGIWSTTRVHASPVSFEDEGRKEGSLSAQTIPC